MTKDDMVALAKQKASAYQLDATLVCAVVEQESSWNPWSVRYEPGFMLKYVSPLYMDGRFSPTEAYCRSMSWGLMQIMGQTARELGFTLATLAELCDPPFGLEYGCRKLAECFKLANGSRIAALEKYNGGANVTYAAEVMNRVNNYRTVSV
jgi:soluble lytic murein transglycosylase-like protein